ncbi:hypothetical protein D3C73_640940 [compost metagenome]
MSFQYSATHHQVLYQADPDVVHTLRSIRNRIHQICSSHANRLVRIQTIDGHVYEGVIVNCDSGHVYLRVSNPGVQRAFFGPSDAAILTLVLFELLVIVLLS